jgi:MFS family permease
MPAMAAPGDRRLPPLVVALGVVSLLNDMSAEMIYPLLPLFLTQLGAGPAALGLIEGAADATASLVTLATGHWADRSKDRSRLVLGGYALASGARSLTALAPNAASVLAIRLSDRFGKGIRTPARDALVSEAVEPQRRGRAFGFHRAMDNAGSIVGPLLAWAALTFGGASLRRVFAWAALPALAAVGTVAWKVREPASGSRRAPPRERRLEPPTPAMRRYLGIIFLFSLTQSSDAFLLLRASQLGVATAMIPVLWAAFHVVKSGLGMAGGELSDRVGRRPVISAGWIVYALSYAGFAVASGPGQAWALFLFYGLFYALTEGPEKALLADLAGRGAFGAAFGWFNFVSGVSLLLASLLFGLLWKGWGPSVAFASGAALALVSTALFLLTDLPPPPKAEDEETLPSPSQP